MPNVAGGFAQSRPKISDLDHSATRGDLNPACIRRYDGGLAKRVARSDDDGAIRFALGFKGDTKLKLRGGRTMRRSFPLLALGAALLAGPCTQMERRSMC